MTEREEERGGGEVERATGKRRVPEIGRGGKAGGYDGSYS
jgi:hypothetical protein